MNEKAEVRCGERGILVTEEQLKKIKGEFWNESSDVLGNDMIEIDEAYDIVCRCIGYEEKWIMYMTT
mgnify:CR=1 FL=1